MQESSKIDRTDKGIPTKHIADLRKDLAKYEESVNKCDIHNSNILANIIGSDMDYILYANIGTTDEQKQEIKKVEQQFLKHVESLRRCTCIKKIK